MKKLFLRMQIAYYKFKVFQMMLKYEGYILTLRSNHEKEYKVVSNYASTEDRIDVLLSVIEQLQEANSAGDSIINQLGLRTMDDDEL